MTTEQKVETAYAFIESEYARAHAENNGERIAELDGDLAVWLITCLHFGLATPTEKGLADIDEFIWAMGL